MTQARTEPGRAGVATSPPAAADEAAPAPGLRERARSLCSACRRVFGIPDHERYLAHAAIWHPGEPVLDRRAFFARETDRKYARGGARCC